MWSWIKKASTVSLAAALAVGIPAAASAEPAAARQTVVALTFDDGTADHARVAKMLRERGLRGTFYVNSGRLGRRGYLTAADLRSMAKAGHEIGGHTREHVRLAHLSPDQQRRQICEDRRALLRLGLKVRSFAYPFGNFDQTSRELAMYCGYTSARGINGLYRPDTCRSCPYAETIPPADLALVRTTSQTRMPRTARNLAASVTRAQAHGGGLVTFVFHRIRDDKRDQYATSPKEFTRFIDWLARQQKAKKVVVKPLGEVVGGRVWPVPGDS
ncbi:MAG: polysaccharide deacetylase family protein [Thermobispora sp.]|nr:polysaccharide deacetylase family protein [Thermobispora sp.]